MQGKIKNSKKCVDIFVDITYTGIVLKSTFCRGISTDRLVINLTSHQRPVINYYTSPQSHYFLAEVVAFCVSDILRRIITAVLCAHLVSQIFAETKEDFSQLHKYAACRKPAAGGPCVGPHTRLLLADEVGLYGCHIGPRDARGDPAPPPAPCRLKRPA